MAKLYLVTYDKNAGDDYTAVYDRIKQCGSVWHGMQNTWFVYTEMSAMDIANHLFPAIDRNDKLFVTQVPSNSAWAGFTDDGTNWFRARLAA